MDGQLICLKWNSFQSSIVTSFESLWEEQGFVDVTLASDGHCVQAHKIILSACSPFFKKIFQANPCQHPVIILQDVRFTEIESLLSFIYKGEVNIDQKDLGDLLRAAETLQIRGLSGTLNQSKSKKKKSSASKKASLNKSTDSLADEQPPVKKTKISAKEEPRVSSPPPLAPFAPTLSARSLSPEPSQLDDPIASDADSLLTPVLTLQDDAFDDEDSMDKTARQAAQAMDEMRAISHLESVETTQELTVGATYSSYDLFKAALEIWADAGHHPMSVHQSRRISDETIPHPYKYVTYGCKHFGKPHLGNTRPNMLSKRALRQECPVRVDVCLSQTLNVYVVRKIVSEHNHPVNSEQRDTYPDKRIPKGKDRETIYNLLKLNVSREAIIRFARENLGIMMTYRGLIDLKYQKECEQVKKKVTNFAIKVDPSAALARSPADHNKLAQQIAHDHGYFEEVVLLP